MRYLLFAMVLGCIPACAQFSGRLSGSVLDASGAPVAGANVGLYLLGGTKPVLSTATARDGGWRFTGIRPTDYDVTVEAPGFAKSALRSISVDPARETDVPPITLQLPTVNQSLDVVADAQRIETGSAEIADTISVQQVQKLPMVDRDPLALVQTLPGVVYNGNGATTINGLRTSYSNMTLDGINIQDNYIRDNGLDYTPNKVLLGQIRQVTLVTSNANAAAPGGATQLALETPSGTNAFHGQAFWSNRNSHFAANDWFNNQAGLGLARLNQNQGGFSLGGPVRRDKLFFYGNYELVRAHQQSPQETTILTDSARAGVFTYRNTAGAQQQVNLFTLKGVQIDPYMQNLLVQIPAASRINSFTVGDSAAGALRNAAGYRFNQRDNETRDNVTARLDYNLSTKHVFSGSYIWNRDNADVPVTDYSVTPETTNPNHSHFLSAAWRWTPSGNLTNELRGGFNLAPGDFLTSQQPGAFLLTGTLFTNPVAQSLPQGRATNTWVLADNAAWQRGRHYIQFGVHSQNVRVHAYDNAGIVPTYTLAMGSGQTAAIARADLPGSRASDVTAANALLATLGGFIDRYSQTFNVTSPTSGYVKGAGNVRDFRLSEYDVYIQDNWKVLPRVTATLGLRWDLPGVADEANSLALLPVIQNNNPVQTLLSNAALNFAGASVGRAWYARDWKDFAPNAGLAWDVSGNGKTSVRAGYSISYVNDAGLVAAETMVESNAGLVGAASKTGLSGRVTGSLPSITAPAYKIPLTVADNYASNAFNNVGLINPNLRTPYVQQWSVGVQQEFLHTVFEARYVGNHLVGGYRAFDYNQVDVQKNGFLADYLRAQNNGVLAQKAGGAFNPAYNAAIAGSQPLTVFPNLAGGGRLTSASIRNLIQDGEAGTLAATYQETGTNGSVKFFANPNALGANMLNNYSSSSYNSLQFVVSHRARAGLDFGGNYSFSKVLSDTAGDSQTRIEQFLDINNPKLERARAAFDLRHSIKGTAIYDIPLGKGHRLEYRPLEKLLSGWSLGETMGWQSGAPFSILSGYGTLNRYDGSRSYYNTANTALNMSQLVGVVQFQMTGNGPYMVAQSAINPSDGSGVNGAGVGLPPPFTGQVFANPGAGTLGTLQRRAFSGPWSFNVDASMQKVVKISERQSVELRMQGVNILNHPTFWSGDQNINDSTFGAVASMLNQPRKLQFDLRYQF